MLAPAMAPDGEKKMRTNFPKRDELLLRIVCALPNDSRIGFACRICRSSSPSLLGATESSSAARPLKLDDRGKPESGADAPELDGSFVLAIAARY